ncbi:HNH endonuclease [Nocardioides eburneiflavus]|uniref:HNH endonuclease n=1 Tax=Nocardioides eburneiflavus TaxID=2518372 RepID=A0A4Z1BTM8_9ACTN|nr:HNH endonuclease family protein [Nocardioides eburneiflavus]TGN64691.1 HNH endonuclease [Nocardioides eburneiflavus]
MSRSRKLHHRPTAARRWSSALLVPIIGALLLLAPAPAQAATFSGTLAQAVAAVPTAAEANTGYDRTLFKHWVDANGDCQNARAEVLISEAEPDTPLTYTTSGKCTVSTGRWFSYYDRVSWTLASDVDIDHMVPLAEAWGSGASGWTAARREAYANDLGDYRTLVGVTDNVNQSKSDQGPSTWLPTYDKCRYVAEWVAVKIRWGLTADSAEKSVLNSYASTCSNTVTVTTA